MKLFEFKNWQLTVSEEAWGLLPFKAILDRDKSKSKEMAMKEMLFVFYSADIKSNYLTMDPANRTAEIKKDVGLPSKWKVDKVIKEAIEFYKSRSTSVIQTLYLDAVVSAQAIGGYLRDTKNLLQERDNNNKPIYDVSKITAAVQKVPKLMEDLDKAYKQVVKEQEDNDNKKKGSRQFNTFEDGL